MEERVGGAVGAGGPLTVVGRTLEPGQPAPDFTLDHFDGSAMRSISLRDLAGSVVVLNVVTRSTRPCATCRPVGWTGCSPGPRC